MSLVKLEPSTFFAALADPTRLRLIRVLAHQPVDFPLCVNALAGRLGVSQPAVSQHLHVLRSVGLVRAVRRGPRVHYYLDRERFLHWQRLVQEFFEFAGEKSEKGEDVAGCQSGSG